MVNPKKHKVIKENNQKKEEFEERIIEGMQAGFNWAHENWSIRQILNSYNEGILIDPSYQRKPVWPAPKNKALIETIFKYGGNKIPTVTFRKLPDGTYEIVDGKQRILSAIIPFCNDEFRLKGVYEDEFSGRNLSDIQEEHKGIHTAFMGTTIPVQIATNMSEEEARIYFIQINTSGVNMTIGEQIHGMQGTPLIKVIEKLLKHPVWNNVQNIKRYGEYAYVSRMLLHVIDDEKGKNIKVYTKNQLIDTLERYYEVPIPKSAVSSLKKTMDVLNKICVKENVCLSIREFFTVFIYVHNYRNELNTGLFGEFLKGLYKGIHNGEQGVFFTLKNQPNVSGFDYSPKYYYWYINNVNYLYGLYLEGAKWDEIQRAILKG